MVVSRDRVSYRDAGVDTERAEEGLQGLLRHIRRTFEFRAGARGSVVLPIGFFANVLDLGNGTGLAISTDGIGSKAIVAQMLDRYDTVGIDCVAMNANDVLCVGAEPISLVDYVAVHEADPRQLEEMARGLADGAEIAGISISGGEIAQLPDLIRNERAHRGFDLVGTCVGLVQLDRMVLGKDVQPGDAIVGLASGGIHSNGLSLARKVLFERAGMSPTGTCPELDRSIGEELLRPTRIYVREVLEMLRAGLGVKGLAHITSDGFLNLCRLDSALGYRVERLPETPPVFSLIQKHGHVSDGEMYSTFNMGVGFCVVVAPEDADSVVAIAAKHGTDAWILGHASADLAGTVAIEPLGLVGSGHEFRQRL